MAYLLTLDFREPFHLLLLQLVPFLKDCFDVLLLLPTVHVVGSVLVQLVQLCLLLDELFVHVLLCLKNKNFFEFLLMLFCADPAFIIYCILASLMFGVCLNQAFVQLPKNVLLGFDLALVVALILFNVTLRSFVETFKELFISPVFLGLFIAILLAFFNDLRNFTSRLAY